MGLSRADVFRARIDQLRHTSVEFGSSQSSLLERDVTVAGVGPKIELWNSARFETNLIQTQARFEEMAISLAAKLGS